jgi:2'-5' RNA ligase
MILERYSFQCERRWIQKNGEMTADRFNLFFAIFPDSETAAKIKTLAADRKKAIGLKGRLQAAGRLHISLLGLGSGYPDLPEEIIEKAHLAGDHVNSPPFKAEFLRTESFDRKSDNNYPFVLSGDAGLDALKAFRATLYAAAKKAGLGPVISKSGFTPHVTLLYADRLAGDEYPVTPPICWDVKEFALVWSHIGKSRYELLGKWPLRVAI